MTTEDVQRSGVGEDVRDLALESDTAEMEPTPQNIMTQLHLQAYRLEGITDAIAKLSTQMASLEGCLRGKDEHLGLIARLSKVEERVGWILKVVSVIGLAAASALGAYLFTLLVH